MGSPYYEYIENFDFVLDVHEAQPFKCVICSFDNQLVISFSSILVEQKIQEEFVNQLKSHGVSCNVKIQQENNTFFQSKKARLLNRKKYFKDCGCKRCGDVCGYYLH